MENVEVLKIVVMHEVHMENIKVETIITGDVDEQMDEVQQVVVNIVHNQ